MEVTEVSVDLAEDLEAMEVDLEDVMVATEEGLVVRVASALAVIVFSNLMALEFKQIMKIY